MQYTMGAKVPKITETEDKDVEPNLGGLYQNVWLAVGALADISFDNLEVAEQIAQCRRAALDFNLDWDDVVAPARHRHLVDFRRLCCQHLRNGGWSYSQIGKFLGGRDHATAIHAYKTAEHLLIYDRTFRQAYKKFHAS